MHSSAAGGRWDLYWGDENLAARIAGSRRPLQRGEREGGSKAGESFWRLPLARARIKSALLPDGPCRHVPKCPSGNDRPLLGEWGHQSRFLPADQRWGRRVHMVRVSDSDSFMWDPYVCLHTVTGYITGCVHTVSGHRLWNGHVALSNLRNWHVPCHYISKAHVTKPPKGPYRPYRFRGLGPLLIISRPGIHAWTIHGVCVYTEKYHFTQTLFSRFSALFKQELFTSTNVPGVICIASGCAVMSTPPAPPRPRGGVNRCPLPWLTLWLVQIRAARPVLNP